MISLRNRQAQLGGPFYTKHAKLTGQYHVRAGLYQHEQTDQHQPTTYKHKC